MGETAKLGVELTARLKKKRKDLKMKSVKELVLFLLNEFEIKESPKWG